MRSSLQSCSGSYGMSLKREELLGQCRRIDRLRSLILLGNGLFCLEAGLQ